MLWKEANLRNLPPLPLGDMEMRTLSCGWALKVALAAAMKGALIGVGSVSAEVLLGEAAARRFAPQVARLAVRVRRCVPLSGLELSIVRLKLFASGGVRHRVAVLQNSLAVEVAAG